MGSISPTFYAKLLREQIPKAQKRLTALRLVISMTWSQSYQTLFLLIFNSQSYKTFFLRFLIFAAYLGLFTIFDFFLYFGNMQAYQQKTKKLFVSENFFIGSATVL